MDYMNSLTAFYQNKFLTRQDFHPSLLTTTMWRSFSTMTTPFDCVVGALVIGGTNLKLVMGRWHAGRFIRVGEVVKDAVPGSRENTVAARVHTAKNFYNHLAQRVTLHKKDHRSLFLTINFAFPVDEQGVVLRSLHKLTIDLTGTHVKQEFESRIPNLSVALVHDAEASLFASQADAHCIVGTGFGGAVVENDDVLTNIEPGKIALPQEEPFISMFPPESFAEQYRVEKFLVAGPGIVAGVKRAFPAYSLDTLTTADCALLFDQTGKPQTVEHVVTQGVCTPLVNLHKTGVSYEEIIVKVKEVFSTSAQVVASSLIALARCYPAKKSFRISYEGSVMEKNPWYVDKVRECFAMESNKQSIDLFFYKTQDPLVEVAMEGALREAGLRVGEV